MSKDPAFLFYPGDYLRDTQCLSENSQVVYDRIMCEHMRNICLRQEQLNFFTKKLNDDEKAELIFLLEKDEEGYFIPWVRESIIKRREYSDSRRKNRVKKEETHDKHMFSHDEHMENEIEIEDEDINKEEEVKKKKTRFQIPAESDVILYLQEELSIKYQRFKSLPSCEIFFEKWFSYYESNGWKVGKNQMKSWKASIRQWLSKEPIQNEGKQNYEKIKAFTRANIHLMSTEKMLRAAREAEEAEEEHQENILLLEANQ